MPITMREHRQSTVAGLHVHEWPAAGSTVLALPGLGSSGIVWNQLAEQIPDMRVVSPDLRGRGLSSSVAGPSGLRHHAADVAAILEKLDLTDVIVVGHSMGAYLAPVVAEQAPSRAARLVLVDGGVPATLPFFMKEPVTRLTWKLAMRKARRDWPDAETFTQKMFSKQVGSRTDLLPVITQWMEYELEGPLGARRPRLSTSHAVGDAVDVFHGPDVRTALENLHVPAHLIAADHREGDAGKPFLSDSALEAWERRLPLLTTERVPDTNHATVVFSDAVIRALRNSRARRSA
jgi:pimeloyl-ACP methyl ester carboxylesterase